MKKAITTAISLCLMCVVAQSEDETVAKQIEPVALIRGSVDDPDAFAVQAQAARVTDQESLKQLWKKWKIAAEMPKVDFEKQFVVTTTWDGSRQNVAWGVLPDGVFFFGAGGTKDDPPGFRYTIGVFNWEGVRSVNGVTNPALKDETVAKQIEPVALIKGSVDDADAFAGQAQAARVTDQESLKQLWKKWKIAAEMPKVDFEKQFVVTTTWGGSRQNVAWGVLPDGEFFFGGGGTKDIRPGLRYTIGVFNWEGVRTVNGVTNPALREATAEKGDPDQKR